jgi:hypothetical protein
VDDTNNNPPSISAPEGRRPRSAVPAVVAAVLVLLLLGVAGAALTWHFQSLAREQEKEREREGKKVATNEKWAPTPGEANEIPRRMWRPPFRSAEGRFVIAFPGVPQPEETETAFKVGRVKRYAYSCVVADPDVSFRAEFMDLTPEVVEQCPPEECFDYLRDGILGQLKEGKVVESTVLPQGVHPGRRCLLQGGGVNVVARMVAAPAGKNTRLFLLTMNTVGVRPNTDDRQMFFLSFQYPK